MRLGHQVHDLLQEMRKLNALLTSEVATVEHAQSGSAAIPMFLNVSGIDWAGKANPTQISVRKTERQRQKHLAERSDEVPPLICAIT